MSLRQGAAQIRNIKIRSESLGNLAKFEYQDDCSNQKYFNERVESIWNLGNASYISLQNILSSFLLTKSVKFMIQNHTLNFTGCLL